MLQKPPAGCCRLTSAKGEAIRLKCRKFSLKIA